MDDFALFNEWQLALEESKQANLVLMRLAIMGPVNKETKQLLELAAVVFEKAHRKLGDLNTRLMNRSAERWLDYYNI